MTRTTSARGNLSARAKRSLSSNTSTRKPSSAPTRLKGTAMCPAPTITIRAAGPCNSAYTWTIRPEAISRLRLAAPRDSDGAKGCLDRFGHGLVPTPCAQ